MSFDPLSFAAAATVVEKGQKKSSRPVKRIVLVEE